MDDPRQTKDGYSVGYGKPPKHTRFKKGKSGNPKGRPRRERDIAALFNKALDRRIRLKEDGTDTTVPVREALIRSIVHDALKGKAKALDLVVKFMLSADPEPGFEVLKTDETALKKMIMEYLDAGWTAPEQGDEDDGDG